MYHRLAHRFPRDVSRASLISSRVLVAVAMLFGTMSLGFQGASAQSDEDAGTYDSPSFGYALEWDADQWSVESESEAATNGGRDFLALLDADGTTVLFTEGSEDSWSDTSDCVDTLFSELGVDVADGELVDDADGNPFEIDEDNHTSAAYVIPVELDSGESQDQVLLVDCYADPDSDLIVGFSSRTAIVDDYGTDGYGLIEPIISSLLFANGSGNSDATPQITGRDATPVASDDGATPVASDGSGTPVAGNAGANEDAGTYESPTFGYRIAWDAENWTVESDGEASADYPRDLLQLLNADETTLLFLESAEGEWADTDECVSTLFEEISVDPDPDAAVEDPETGDPYEISEDGHSAAAYTHAQGDSDVTVLVDCRQDPDSDVIVGLTSISNEVDDYFGVEYPAVEEILDSLEF